MIFDFSGDSVYGQFRDRSDHGEIPGIGMRGNCIQVTGVTVYIEKLLRLSGVYKFVEICGELKNRQVKREFIMENTNEMTIIFDSRPVE